MQAARTRLRPILMTSLAFILGVVPLVIATGAGAELRQALGTAVFFGMLGVTLFGLLFTPVFYVLIRWIGSRQQIARALQRVKARHPKLRRTYERVAGPRLRALLRKTLGVRYSGS